MKILVVTQHYYPEQFKITEICEELVLRGNQVDVLTGLPNYPEGKIYKGYLFRNRKQVINGVKVIRCSLISRGKSNLRLFINYLSFWINSKLKVLSIDKDYDVVLTHGTSPIMQISAGILYKQKNNRRVITYCQDIWPEALKTRGLSENSFAFKYFKKVSKNLYDLSDVILVSSKSFIEYLSNVHQIEEEKIKYFPQHANDEYLKLDLKKPQDNYIDLLFCGLIGKAQNIDMVIEAIKILNISNLRFHIVGNGSEYENCKALVEEYNLADKVIMYGRKDIKEIPNFYKMADACVLTLSNKTLNGLTIPTKMQDYMAGGKFILGSINGEAQSIIKEANCGLCANADDIESFIGVIKEFVNNYDKYKNLGENGKNYFKQHFTKKIFIDKLEVILRENSR